LSNCQISHVTFLILEQYFSTLNTRDCSITTEPNIMSDPLTQINHDLARLNRTFSLMPDTWDRQKSINLSKVILKQLPTDDKPEITNLITFVDLSIDWIDHCRIAGIMNPTSLFDLARKLEECVMHYMCYLSMVKNRLILMINLCILRILTFDAIWESEAYLSHKIGFCIIQLFTIEQMEKDLNFGILKMVAMFTLCRATQHVSSSAISQTIYRYLVVSQAPPPTTDKTPPSSMIIHGETPLAKSLHFANLILYKCTTDRSDTITSLCNRILDLKSKDDEQIGSAIYFTYGIFIEYLTDQFNMIYEDLFTHLGSEPEDTLRECREKIKRLKSFFKDTERRFSSYPIFHYGMEIMKIILLLVIIPMYDQCLIKYKPVVQDTTIAPINSSSSSNSSSTWYNPDHISRYLVQMADKDMPKVLRLHAAVGMLRLRTIPDIRMTMLYFVQQSMKYGQLVGKNPEHDERSISKYTSFVYHWINFAFEHVLCNCTYSGRNDENLIKFESDHCKLLPNMPYETLTHKRLKAYKECPPGSDSMEKAFGSDRLISSLIASLLAI